MNGISIVLRKKHIIFSIIYILSSHTYALDGPPKSSIIDLTPEIIRQDQRISEFEKKLTGTNIKLVPKKNIEKITHQNVVVVETPCFEIKELKIIINDPIQGESKSIFNHFFYDLNEEDFIIGKCIGTESLRNFIKYSQNELIKKGFITTQAIVNSQDLTKGTLVLNLRIGRIHQIYSKDQSVSKFEIFSAFPFVDGEILNLKKIDQGLENLKRISNRDIDIKIEPSLSNDGHELVGFSDLVISSKPYNRFGVSLGIDDSGSKNTGEYIGNLGVTVNNPLSINDVLNINLSHSLDDWYKNFNKSFYINYSIPFKNYFLSASYNEYEYQQMVAGFNKPISYSGETKQSNLVLTRLLSRNGQHKTSMYTKLYRKENINFVENFKIGVQHRQTAGWHTGIQHRQYIGNALLDFNLDYRRGTGALNAKSAPEERIVDIYGRPLAVEGYARAPLWSADIHYTQPFIILNHPIQYRLNWRGQYAPKILVPQDRIYIGGRYSVRGFSGDVMLSGDNGHYLQQEFSWNSFIPNTQFYTGIDQGWVNGRNSYPGKRHLLGSVFGTRSYFKNMYFDAFAGHGLVAPKNIKKEWVTGFSFNFSY